MQRCKGLPYKSDKPFFSHLIMLCVSLNKTDLINSKQRCLIVAIKKTQSLSLERCISLKKNFYFLYIIRGSCTVIEPILEISDLFLYGWLLEYVWFNNSPTHLKSFYLHYSIIILNKAWNGKDWTNNSHSVFINLLIKSDIKQLIRSSVY